MRGLALLMAFGSLLLAGCGQHVLHDGKLVDRDTLDAQSSTLDTPDAAPECPGHWHTSFHVIVNGEVARFPKPPYALSGEAAGDKLPLRMHMHAGDRGDFLHYEPTTPTCMDVQETFELLDVILREDKIAIVDPVGREGVHDPVAAGTYKADSQHPLRAFVQVAETTERDYAGGTFQSFESYQPWAQLTMTDLLALPQLPDYTKLLIVYGPASDDDVAQWQAQVTNPPGTQ